MDITNTVTATLPPYILCIIDVIWLSPFLHMVGRVKPSSVLYLFLVFQFIYQGSYVSQVLVKESESSVVGQKRNVRFRMREIADKQV